MNYELTKKRNEPSGGLQRVLVEAGGELQLVGGLVVPQPTPTRPL